MTATSAAAASGQRRPRGPGVGTGVAPDPRGRRAPAANAAAVGKRSAGALAIARTTLCSTAMGTVSRTVRSGGTGSSAWRARSPWGVGAVNGGWPASIS